MVRYFTLSLLLSLPSRYSFSLSLSTISLLPTNHNHAQAAKTDPTTTSASLHPFPSNPNPRKSPIIGSAPKSKIRRSLAPSLIGSDFWHPLPISESELSLPLTLPTGQSFRWRQTSPSAFSSPIAPHLLSLRHVSPSHVSFLHHRKSPSFPIPTVRLAIEDYFNLDVDLGDLWRGFSAAYPRFAALAEKFSGGALMLRQGPIESLPVPLLL